MITFTHPAFLLFLAFIPPLIYLRHIWTGRGGRLSFSHTIWQKEMFKPSFGLNNVLLITANLAFWSAFILFLTALAGPEIVSKEKIYLTRGIDIMFVVDESPSMAAKDFVPRNRFTAAKEVIKDFIKGRDHDPIGLVTFGKDAVLRIPPTLDYSYIMEQLDNLSVMSLGDGTSIGMGLAVAALHLKESSAGKKIIILVTDGENNAGEITPVTASTIAASLGIKIFSIGIGSGREVPLEYTDPVTGKTFSGLYKGVYDKGLLKKVAAVSGGRFFSADTPGALDNVVSAIDSLERIEMRSRMRIKNEPIHRKLILLGLILMLYVFFIRKWIMSEVL